MIMMNVINFPFNSLTLFFFVLGVRLGKEKVVAQAASGGGSFEFNSLY